MDRHHLHLQRYLFTGVLTLLPLWLTWVVFKFVFNLLSGLSAPWIQAIAGTLASHFPRAFGWLQAMWVQSLVALAITIIVIYLVGFAVHRVVGQRALAWLEGVIARIPLVQSIYGGTKKLVELMQNKPDGTQRVVLIDFPNDGMKAVGLVTRIIRDETDGTEYAAVYVPTTPIPTSGYLEIVPLDRVIPTDWTMDQAMAFIISGGAVAPDRFRVPSPKPTL